MNSIRRVCVSVLALYTLIFGGFDSVSAQTRSSADYPSKPIRWIVPFAPGGASDFSARLISTKMPDFLKGQTVVVENRPGGNTVIGTQQLAVAPPDGHTIAIAMDSVIANQYLMKSVPYRWEDFEPVRLLFTTPLVFIVKPDSPVNSMKEAIEWIKKNDGALTYGTWGTGSTAHFAGEALGQALGVRMIQVPYAGAAPSVQAMLGGQLDILIAPANQALPYIKEGKLKPLSVLSKTRMEQLPAVPPISDALGKVFDFNSWVGVIAPKSTPPAVVNKISEAISTAMKRPEVAKAYEDLGSTVLNAPPAEFKAVLSNDARKIDAIVKSRRLTLE